LQKRAFTERPVEEFPAGDYTKEAEMQIPKQPRTKPPAAEVLPPESKPAGSESSAAPWTAEDLNKELQQAYSSYVENVNSANLQAQLEHAKAYLSYLETVQQQPGSDPTLAYWKEILQAHDNTQAAADVQKRFAMASVERQASSQKTLADAVTAYSQTTRDIWDKLQRDVEQHNKEIADSLKDALLKVDVNTSNIPALSMLYQGIRTMSATPAGDGTKAG
jgi:hypothetical protein